MCVGASEIFQKTYIIMKILSICNRVLCAIGAVLFLIVCITAVPQVPSEKTTEDDAEAKEEYSHRGDRVLIGFGQTQDKSCLTNDETNTKGTCLPYWDCKYKEGISAGSCANGLGTCCLFRKSCGTETTLNNTYFVHPENSSKDEVGACTLTINRVSTSICQVRLDFLSLQLSQPDADGKCNTDFLTVTGGNNNIPMICGINDNQHIYVDVDPNGGALELTVDRSTTVSSSRAWNIRVSQIACDSRYKAPQGCLQFFTATSGTVRSFNFANDAPDSEYGTRQISNQDYGVCIQRASGYCGIIWERDTVLGDYSFTVSLNVNAVDPGLIGDPAASTTGELCTTDFVVIPGGVDNEGKQSDRYCGLGFPKSVTSTATPFVLFVKNDDDEAMDSENRGFRLNYRQTTTC